MQLMGLTDANDTGNTGDAAATTDDEDGNSSGNEGEDEGNGLEEDNHMEIDAMGNNVFGQGMFCTCMRLNCASIAHSTLHKESDHNYSDREMGYHSERNRSETPSSTRSWLNVPTPPPTPPSTPPPGSNDEEQASVDEDGFMHITEDDYRDYERWYAEDDMLELNEMSKLIIYRIPCFA
jgi:hypothetical protein